MNSKLYSNWDEIQKKIKKIIKKHGEYDFRMSADGFVFCIDHDMACVSKKENAELSKVELKAFWLKIETELNIIINLPEYKLLSEEYAFKSQIIRRDVFNGFTYRKYLSVKLLDLEIVS
jgi:hypothetical protein